MKCERCISICCHEDASHVATWKWTIPGAGRSTSTVTQKVSNTCLRSLGHLGPNGHLVSSRPLT